MSSEDFSLTNPPNPVQPDFKIAVSRVATLTSIHLNNDDEKFLKFGTGLLQGTNSIELTSISQSRDDYSEKCRKVLDIWARKNGSKWEDVIKQLNAIGLTALAAKLTEKLAESTSQPPAPGTVNDSSAPATKPLQLPARSELSKTSSSSPKGSPDKKAKSQLNEQFQKYSISDAKYTSSDDVAEGNVHNFRATLTYSVYGRKYQYESHGVFSRKQNAEEDTAKQALSEIEHQAKQPGGVSCKQWLKERYCDERQLPAPQYTTDSTSGGFVSTVDVPQHKPVRGPVGNNKREAEQLAAMEALKQLKL